jgi:hypothetical protein
MSPAFVYLFAFGVWLFAACLVWLASGVMSLLRGTRSTARCLGLAMAGTFPVVFLYQAVAAPIALVILSAVALFRKVVEPGGSAQTTSPVVIGVTLTGAFAAFAVVLGMSLLGFHEGWRIGWEVGAGRRLGEAIDRGASTRFLAKVLNTIRAAR